MNDRYEFVWKWVMGQQLRTGETMRFLGILGVPRFWANLYYIFSDGSSFLW